MKLASVIFRFALIERNGFTLVPISTFTGALRDPDVHGSINGSTRAVVRHFEIRHIEGEHTREIHCRVSVGLPEA